MEKNAPFNGTHECDTLLICVAPGCNNSSITSKSLQFHRFPDLEMGKHWQTTLGIVVKPRSSMDAVCSMHFREEDYLEEQYQEGHVEKTRRTLKPEALPHVDPSQPHKTNSPQQSGNKHIKEEVGYIEVSPLNVDKYCRRDEKGIIPLTQKFVELLKSRPDGLLDIGDAEEALKVPRRRIYDITNALEGLYLLKKKSTRVVQWLGSTGDYDFNRVVAEKLARLIDEEQKLDDIIKCTKQHLSYIYESSLYNKYSYVTYEDLQNIPMFVEQAMFVIKAPSETTIAVAHPKENLQLHISSKKGPVTVFGCTDDNVQGSQNKRQKTNLSKGDYSNVPLRVLSSAAAATKDNANQKTKKYSSSTCRPEPTKSLIQDSTAHVSPAPTLILPPHEVVNSSTPIGPLSLCIKEELINLNVTPDGPMNVPPGRDLDRLSTDVHMTDVS